MYLHTLWTAAEKSLIDTVAHRLVYTNRVNDYKLLQRNLSALNCQAEAFRLYPDIIDGSSIAGSTRNIETLVGELAQKYRNEDIFVIPTKAILGRCIEISRINVLYMLFHLARSPDVNTEIQRRTHEYIMTHMLSIMTEDVLLGILGDGGRAVARQQATHLLARIWEERLSVPECPFVPELSALWLIRRDSTPVFGTLMGTHEYYLLLKNADDVTRNYILHALEVPDEATALEEFLFGLPYESLQAVREHLRNSAQSSINREGIAQLLGTESLYLSSAADDPLELYRFFNFRRTCALSRRNARNQGPIRTFEENFMSYLLTLGSENQPAAQHDPASSRAACPDYGQRALEPESI